MITPTELASVSTTERHALRRLSLTLHGSWHCNSTAQESPPVHSHLITDEQSRGAVDHRRSGCYQRRPWACCARSRRVQPRRIRARSMTPASTDHSSACRRATGCALALDSGDRSSLCMHSQGRPAPSPRAVEYSNAGDKPWQMAALGGTLRIRVGISERGAAIC